MISFVSTSSLPGFMIALSRVQQRDKCCGCVASARQIAGTWSIFFVSLMSLNTSWINGLGSSSSTSFTVGMAHSPFFIASVSHHVNWYRMVFFALLEQYSVP